MQLGVNAPVQTDKTVGVTMSRIVVRPMYDRPSSGIVHHLTANLNAVAGRNRAARRDADVVHDLDAAGTALNVECFVHSVCPRSVEEARRRGDDRREIDPCRRRAGVRCRQIHAALITRAAAIDKPLKQP